MKYIINVNTKQAIKKRFPTSKEIEDIVGKVPNSIDSLGNIEIDKDLTDIEKKAILDLLISLGW